MTSCVLPPLTCIHSYPIPIFFLLVSSRRLQPKRATQVFIYKPASSGIDWSTYLYIYVRATINSLHQSSQSHESEVQFWRRSDHSESCHCRNCRVPFYKSWIKYLPSTLLLVVGSHEGQPGIKLLWKPCLIVDHRFAMIMIISRAAQPKFKFKYRVLVQCE